MIKSVSAIEDSLTNAENEWHGSESHWGGRNHNQEKLRKFGAENFNTQDKKYNQELPHKKREMEERIPDLEG